jgi:hypothetical protein
VAAVAVQGSPSVTVSFQEGVDGYVGTFDKRLGSDGTNELGSAVANYFVDGQSTTDSPDIQGLIRFDNIFGAGAGRIPAGATILDARLTLTTASGDPLANPPGSANAQTPGPWGVAALLRPFTSSTTYLDFGALGPTFRNGPSINVSATRAAGFYDDPIGANTTGPVANPADFNDGQIDQDESSTARVRSLVQNWANDPSRNYGFTVQAGRTGTTDGWMIGTSSHPTLGNRPKLSVTYTMDEVETTTLQQGVNGYSGTVQSWVRQNNNIGATDFVDGAQLNEAFLDGVDISDPASPDDRSLVRFNNLFASQGGNIEDDAEIVDAYLVITTGVSNANARTGGAWIAQQMLTDWDTNKEDSSLPTVFGDFGGGFGPQIGTDVSDAVDKVWGMTPDGQAWFDVKSVLENWQDGEANYGFQIKATDHADGWQIRMVGTSEVSARPQLMVRTLIPTGRWLADANGAWTVNANWLDNKVVNGRGHIAIFGDVITAARTVTLDADQTVGQLRFDSAFSYTIAGTNTLTLDRTSSDAMIQVSQGNHTVSTPVVMVRSTTLDVAADSSLTLTGTIGASGVAVTKTGAGTAVLPGLRAASLSVNGGTIRMAPANTDAAVSVVSALTIAADAKLDLTNNAIVIDYATGGTSPLVAVAGAIAGGQLISSTAPGNYAIGVVEGTVITGGIFGGITLDADAVVADLTLKGDANLNYSVTFDDLLALAQNYDAAGSGKLWSDGDSNYDGRVNFDDLLALAQNYGGNALQTEALLESAGASEQFQGDWALAQSLAPEPSSIAALGMLSMFARRRRMA